MEKLSKFETVSVNELEDLKGGFVITGTMVAAGVGIFVGTYGVGHSIGKSRK